MSEWVCSWTRHHHKNGTGPSLRNNEKKETGAPASTNFDEKGELDSYWSYKSEGPWIYKKEDLVNDKKFYDYIGGNNFPLEVHQGKIIDFDDSLVIGRIIEDKRISNNRQKSQTHEHALPTKLIRYVTIV